MPFESEAQRRFMHARHPEIAKRWERHTPKGRKLPKHKRKTKRRSKAARLLAAWEALHDGHHDESC